MGLKGQADHDARPHLIPDRSQISQTIPPGIEGMILGMEFPVKGRAAGLDPQKITMRAGAEPSLVSFGSLLTERQSDPEFLGGKIFDLPDNVLYE